MEEDIKLLEEKISDGTIYVMCGNSVDEAIKNILTALHKANKEKHNQKSLRRFNERKYRKELSANKEALNHIKQLEEENENLKQAIKINQDLYETKCNENKELEIQRDYYKERYLEFNNAFVQGGKELTKD